MGIGTIASGMELTWSAQDWRHGSDRSPRRCGGDPGWSAGTTIKNAEKSRVSPYTPCQIES
jgi:hypothetical protein